MTHSPAMGFFARKWRRLVQYYGPAAMKREQWDREFKQGRWDYLTDTAHDPVYRVLQKYLHGGSLLDLGCGLGNTPNELPEGSYQRYMGIDISEEAAQMARKRTADNGRAHNTRFAQADIATYVPEEEFSVILLRESAYYLPISTLAKTLGRYAGHLAESGVLVVRLSGLMKPTPKIERILEENFEVVEKQEFESEPGRAWVIR